MNWLSLALAVASLLQWVAGRLTEADQHKLRGAVLALAFLRKADDAIKKADAARAAVRAGRDTDGLRDIRESDGFRWD